MQRGISLTLSLALVVAFVGVAMADKEKSTKDAASKSQPAAKCPVTGEKISKDASIDYKGGKLYFCCAGCIDKFKEDKAKYEAKANVQLVATGQAKQIGCPLSGGKLNPSTKTKVCGIDVCFCCPKCPEKVKSVSAEEQAQIVFVKGFDKAFVVKQPKKGTEQ